MCPGQLLPIREILDAESVKRLFAIRGLEGFVVEDRGHAYKLSFSVSQARHRQAALRSGGGYSTLRLRSNPSLLWTTVVKCQRPHSLRRRSNGLQGSFEANFCASRILLSKVPREPIPHSFGLRLERTSVFRAMGGVSFRLWMRKPLLAEN